MKASRAIILWVVAGIFALSAAGYLVHHLLNPFANPEPAQNAGPASQSAGASNPDPDDGCGLPASPVEEGFFDKRLPDNLKRLAYGPWPKWIRVEENELVFVATGVKVPYANRKFAQMHGDGTMNPQSHTTIADIPLLVPGGRSIAILKLRYFYEGIYFRVIIYDNRGRKRADFDRYPWYPVFSPNGEYMLGSVFDCTADYAKNGVVWLNHMDGSTEFITWGSDILSYFQSQNDDAYGSFDGEVLFTPDCRNCVALVNGKSDWAVVLDMLGTPIGIVPVELKSHDTPANPEVFWKAVADCIASSPGPSPESDRTTSESEWEPYIPESVPDHIRQLASNPLPPWVRVTGSEIQFSSGVTRPFSGHIVGRDWEEPSTGLPFCLPGGKGLVLLELGLSSRRMNFSLYDSKGRLLHHAADLGDWPYVSPDGERILLFKYVEPYPRANWIVRANGRIETLIWWDDIVRNADVPDEWWEGRPACVLPSRDWKHLFVFIDWGEEEGWRVAVLTMDGEFLVKMPFDREAVKVENSRLLVSEETLKALEEYAARLKE